MLQIPAWLKNLFGIDADEALPLSDDRPDVARDTPQPAAQPRQIFRPRGRLVAPVNTLEALIQAVERQIVHEGLKEDNDIQRDIVVTAQQKVDVAVVYVSVSLFEGLR